MPHPRWKGLIPRSRAVRVAIVIAVLAAALPAGFGIHRYRANAELERLLRKGRFGGDVVTTHWSGRVNAALIVLSDTQYGPLPGIGERLQAIWHLLGEPTGIGTAGPGCDLDKLFARLEPLDSLDTIVLGSCGTMGGELNRVTGSPRLRRLWLRDVHLTPEAVRTFDRFRELEDVNLERSTGFGDEALARIAKLPRLRRLALSSRSTATDAGIARLVPLRGLELLSLQGMQLTDDAVPALAEIAPKRLDVRGTKLTANGVHRLRTALPDSVIKSNYDDANE